MRQHIVCFSVLFHGACLWNFIDPRIESGEDKVREFGEDKVRESGEDKVREVGGNKKKEKAN